MIFVLAMLFTFVYDRNNENHWSLLAIRYSLVRIQTPVHECIISCKAKLYTDKIFDKSHFILGCLYSK